MNESLCSSGLLLLFLWGSFYWVLMKSLTIEFCSAKPDGSIGMKIGVQNDASVCISVAAYLMSLEMLWHLCNNMCEDNSWSMQEHRYDIDAMYLQTYMSICSCYAILTDLATPSLYSMTGITKSAAGLGRLGKRLHCMFQYLPSIMFGSKTLGALKEAILQMSCALVLPVYVLQQILRWNVSKLSCRQLPLYRHPWCQWWVWWQRRDKIQVWWRKQSTHKSQGD